MPELLCLENRNALADLLVRSSLVRGPSDREAVLNEIGVHLAHFGCADVTPHAFAVNLVNSLNEAGDHAALEAMLDRIGPLVPGHRAEVDRLRCALSAGAGTAPPPIQDALARVRALLPLASERTEALGNLKQLHDQLHEVEFSCRNRLEHLIRDLEHSPGDEDCLEDLKECTASFRAILERIHEVAGRLAGLDTSWVTQLDQALQDLQRAAGTVDLSLLTRVKSRLTRELAKRPTWIVIRLNEAARSLPLSQLVQEMAAIRQQRSHLQLSAQLRQQFEGNVQELTTLQDHLCQLICTHDRWQEVEDSLRQLEGDLDTEDTESWWPDLKTKAEPLYAGSPEKWAGSFQALAGKLDEAVQHKTPAEIRARFREYRREAGLRFYKVDRDVAQLCEKLRRGDGPLFSTFTILGVWS